jgi:site-specific DNA recombinase
MDVVGYIRVSTETQAKHNDSLSGQISKIKEGCRNNGHNLVSVYTEPGSSAFYDKRPIFKKMIEDLVTKRVRVDGVVVYSLSRFTRNLKEKLNAQEALKGVGVSLYSCTESIPEDPCSGFIMGNIYSTMDEAQSLRNSQVVSDRMQQAAVKGYFTGSHPPFGYETMVAPGTEN